MRYLAWMSDASRFCLSLRLALNVFLYCTFSTLGRLGTFSFCKTETRRLMALVISNNILLRELKSCISDLGLSWLKRLVIFIALQEFGVGLAVGSRILFISLIRLIGEIVDSGWGAINYHRFFSLPTMCALTKEANGALNTIGGIWGLFVIYHRIIIILIIMFCTYGD